jgi:predicted DNA-binding ribbon-helix-helix protein
MEEYMPMPAPEALPASAAPPRAAKKAEQSTLVSKNITIDGHRTSVRLEPAMWNSLTEICRRERSSVHTVCSAIAQHKPANTSLTAAIRVFIMSYFHAAATEEGHVKAGHGQGPAANAVLMLVQSVLDPGSVAYPLPSPYIIGKAYTPPGNNLLHHPQSGIADPRRLPPRR